jgi:hypothetical protein
MKKFAGRVMSWVTKTGSTPAGKALEHAVVAAVALVASAAVSQLLHGNVHAAAVLVGTAAVAGGRAYLKGVTK